MGTERVSDCAVALSVVPVRDFRPVLTMFYREETEEFLRHHHKAHGGVAECVDDMCNTISPESTFYQVSRGRDVVAFFVKANCGGVAVLEGFHIRRGHRTATIIPEFWDIVNVAMAEPYYIGVLACNTPAIHHLTRNGFEIVGPIIHDGQRFLLLKNKLIYLCH